MRGARSVEAGIVLVAVLITLASPAFAEEYTVRPGDILEISVLGEQAVSGPATVTPDGKLVLHMAGEIPATGRTLSQLTQMITVALKQFVRDPQVAVSIRSSRRLFAYVLGRVARPGAYEIEKGWSISQLVAAAGGPANEAALARTLVMRKDETIPVDLEKLIVGGNTSANFLLEPDDVVLVPEVKERVLIMGQVQKPGSYAFKAGDRVVDALGAAGGLTANASVNEVGVIRRQGQKPAVTRLDLDKFYKNADATQNITLQPDDIVYVPEKGVDWLTILNPFFLILHLFK
jgi:protein involved in polysaccharide export with SLBB domain